MVMIRAPEALIPEPPPVVASFAGPLPILRVAHLPQWRDTNFMSQMLLDKLAVTSMSMEDAVAVGENYGSNVMVAKVETTLGTISLFVKSMPESEFRAKWLIETEVFKREIKMYSETLPLIRSCYSKPNFPACFYHESNDKTDSLILKDLRPDGFKTRNRHLGLDEAHCRIALSELAHLHGHSIAIRIQDPESFQNNILKLYADKLYDEKNRDTSGVFFASVLKGIGESICANQPLRFRKLGEMIKDVLADKSFDMVQEHIQVPKDSEQLSKIVLCLNHGDFWSNNILFKYDENGQPIASSLIDFQMARVSAPVLDLMYFFFTSTTQALRRGHMLSLLQFYMDEVKSALSLRGVSDPGHLFYSSLQELHMDFLKRKALGFVMACMVIPAVVADASQIPDDLDDMTEEIFKSMEASPFAKMYSGPLFCERIREMVEDFDDMGFFLECVKTYAKK